MTTLDRTGTPTLAKSARWCRVALCQYRPLALAAAGTYAGPVTSERSSSASAVATATIAPARASVSARPAGRPTSASTRQLGCAATGRASVQPAASPSRQPGLSQAPSTCRQARQHSCTITYVPVELPSGYCLSRVVVWRLVRLRLIPLDTPSWTKKTAPRTFASTGGAVVTREVTDESYHDCRSFGRPAFRVSQAGGAARC